MKTSTCAALLLLAVGLTNQACAESYNLRCSMDSGANTEILLVRETWPSSYILPVISRVGHGPGETTPTDVNVYTHDQLQVTIAVHGGPRNPAFLKITADRNTGRATFAPDGPWQKTPEGVRYQIQLDSFPGTCVRKAPKF